MTERKDITVFLMSRRAKISPAQVGLRGSGMRRVPGLRREEVARLAGVSKDYYVQIERGAATNPSDEVLQSIASALRLDNDESAHLFALVRSVATRPDADGGRVGDEPVPDSLRLLMNAMATAPAVLQNGRLDIVATNPLGRSLYSSVYEGADEAQSPRPNLARFVFLDAMAATLFVDWAQAADEAAALLRVEVGRARDTATTTLVDELADRSPEFRVRWSRQDVRTHRHGIKRFHHSVAGALTLAYDSLHVPGAARLSLVGYTAAPGSPSHAALASLHVNPHPSKESPT